LGYKQKQFSITGRRYKRTIRRKHMALAEVKVIDFPQAEGVSEQEYLGITIKTEYEKKLSEQAYKLLKDYYCKKMKTHHNRHMHEQRLRTLW
jgi:hypothetical protein